MSSVPVSFRRSSFYIGDALLDDLSCQYSSHVSLRSEDGNQVKVHSLVLAAASPFLHQLLSHEELDNSSITIQSVHFKCISLFVQFIYTGEMDCCSAPVARDFVELLELLGCNISLDVVQKSREIVVNKKWISGRNVPIKKHNNGVPSGLNKRFEQLIESIGSKSNQAAETKLLELHDSSLGDHKFSNEHISELANCVDRELSNESIVLESNDELTNQNIVLGTNEDLLNQTIVLNSSELQPNGFDNMSNTMAGEELYYFSDNGDVSEMESNIPGQKTELVGVAGKTEVLSSFSENCALRQNTASSSIDKMKQVCDKEVRVQLRRISSTSLLSGNFKIHQHNPKKNKQVLQTFKYVYKVPTRNKTPAQTGPHSCPRCSASFMSTLKLIAHIKSSHLKCVACKVSFTSRDEQKGHKCSDDIASASMKMRSKKKVFPCKLCTKVYSLRTKQVRHQVGKHGLLERFMCKHCDSYFQTSKEFVDHTKAHLPPGYKYSCDRCAEVSYFKNRHDYDEHRDIVHLVDRYLCPFCKQILPPYYDPETHLAKTCPAIHNIVKERKCNKCSLILPTSTELQAHLSSAHGVKKEYICKLCNNQQFTAFLEMIHHMRVQHSQCQHCKQWFNCKQAVEEHQKMCTRRLKFQCSDCGRRFFLKNVFEAHQQNKCQRVRCDECGKYLLNLNVLKMHMANQHRPPVICHHCQKPCKSKQRLRLHIGAMHMSYDQRPFKCPHSDCDAAFMQGVRLNEHLKSQKHSPETYANTRNNRTNSASQLDS